MKLSPNGDTEKNSFHFLPRLVQLGWASFRPLLAASVLLAFLCKTSSSPEPEAEDKGEQKQSLKKHTNYIRKA